MYLKTKRNILNVEIFLSRSSKLFLNGLIFVFLFLVSACGVMNSSVQSTNPSSSNGTANAGNLKQLKIVDANGTSFTSGTIALNVGQPLGVKAALYNLAGNFLSDQEVYWSIRTISGNLNSGLSCSLVLSNSCSFTPLQLGAAVIEATYTGSDGDVIGFVASSPVIVVSSLTTPDSMAIVSGNNQTVVANSDTSSELKVEVKDSFGQPIAGIGVSFSVTGGGGSVNPSAMTTDQNGIAKTVLKAGTVAGSLNNVVVAQVTTMPALLQTFQASTLSAAADHLTFSTQPGGSYSTLPLSTQPVVQLRDIYENVVPSSANVVLSVFTGSGILSGTTTVAMSNGVATFTGVAYSIVESGVVLRATQGARTVDSVPFNVVTSGGTVDRDPNDIWFVQSVSYVGGVPGRKTSNTVGISGVGVPVDISVSGAGNPMLKLNGGPEVSNLSGVNNGASLAIVADAPTVLGTQNTITVYIGSRIESWNLGYADSTKIAPVFVTNSTSNGTFGSVTVADTTCQSAATAAGLDGTWSALIGDTGTSIRDRSPWNFGVVKNLAGNTVATDYHDFWDGSWGAPINVTEYLTTKNVGVWFGNSGVGIADPGNVGSCGITAQWQLGIGWQGGAIQSSSTSVSVTSESCANLNSFICIGNSSGVSDTNPNDVDFLMDVTYSASTRLSSNTITLSGINTSINVSVAGTAGTPRIKISGGAEVTSGTATVGDTIQVVMDAPAVLGTKNTATITLGTDVYTWHAGYADNTKSARIFVSQFLFPGYGGGGSSNLDSNCQAAAIAAGHSGTWKAFIADTSSGGGPRNRMNFNWGTLRRMDLAVIANNWADLWDGSLNLPIELNETGIANIGSADAWTGSTSVGGFDAATLTTCSNWSSSANFARAGLSTSNTSTWLSSYNRNCGDGTGIRAYCIETVVVSDTLPTNVNFLKSVAYVAGAGGRTTSNAVVVKGINESISVSVAGPGNVAMKINGGAEVTSGTMNWGDTVEIVMDAPAVFGTQYAAVVTLGSGSFQWILGYADNSRIVRMFTSSAVYTSNLSAYGGGDSLCQSLASAAGYSGTWKALQSNATNTNARDGAPFNWGTLKRVDGTTLATSWNDLWDGQLAALPNVDENGNVVSGQALTGATSDGISNGRTCSNWSVGGGSESGVGSVTSTTTWMNSSSSEPCFLENKRLYCIEETISEDVKPNALIFPYKIYQNVSTRIESQAVTVTGITAAATVTLTGAQGNPAFKVNGGAEVTTGTVNNGDTLTLVMDSPGSLLQSHKLQIQVGASPLIPWRVWTGNPSSGIQKRIFITSNTAYGGSYLGIAGINIQCQTRANTNPGLSAATWKGIVSDSGSENEWAINRIGYDWSELWSINPDGSPRAKVMDATQIWTYPMTLQSRIEYSESGTIPSGDLRVWTGTNAYGHATSDTSCASWTGSLPITVGVGSGASINSGWISNENLSCANLFRLYCIEQ